MTEPLRFSFEVACPRERAFALWTERIAAWWPSDHTASGQRSTVVVLEPRLGGRLYEVTDGGEEIPWGEITHWAPPQRLSYSWHLRADRTDATDVEVSFVALGATATRVEIEHRGWERLGDRGAQWRARNERGWSTLIPHYQEAVTR